MFRPSKALRYTLHVSNCPSRRSPSITGGHPRASALRRQPRRFAGMRCHHGRVQAQRNSRVAQDLPACARRTCRDQQRQWPDPRRGRDRQRRRGRRQEDCQGRQRELGQAGAREDRDTGKCLDLEHHDHHEGPADRRVLRDGRDTGGAIQCACLLAPRRNSPLSTAAST